MYFFYKYVKINIGMFMQGTDVYIFQLRKFNKQFQTIRMFLPALCLHDFYATNKSLVH